MDSAFSFIDTHSHILPGIDDGAKDLDESLYIIKKAKEVGVKKIVLTPHVSIDDNRDLLDNIAYQFNTLNTLVLEEGMGVDLYLGAELMLHPELPKRIRDDKRLTINGNGKYALIEVPFFEIPIYAPTVFFGLLAQGITPIWAHPERCSEVIDDYKVVYGYLNRGLLLQINAGSLLGLYGRRVKYTATRLIKEGLGDILASDTHSINVAKTNLLEAFLCVEKLRDKPKAVDMVLSVPSRIIN